MRIRNKCTKAKTECERRTSSASEQVAQVPDPARIRRLKQSNGANSISDKYHDAPNKYFFEDKDYGGFPALSIRFYPSTRE